VDEKLLGLVPKFGELCRILFKVLVLGTKSPERKPEYYSFDVFVTLHRSVVISFTNFTA
jgi:hypothetical protein